MYDPRYPKPNECCLDEHTDGNEDLRKSKKRRAAWDEDDGYSCEDCHLSWFFKDDEPDGCRVEKHEPSRQAPLPAPITARLG